MNYVRMFYTAMSIFVRKHYGGSRAGFFNFLIHLAIWFRAALTATGNFIRKIGLPLIDAALIFLSFWIMKNIWTRFVRTDIHYENKLLLIAFTAYTFFYLFTAYYAGLYDRWYKRSELIKSTLIATIVLLAGYALLPEQYRFSRGIILFGALLAFFLIGILRWILIRANVLGSNKEKEEHLTTIIVASPKEYEEVQLLLKQAGIHQRVLGRIGVNENDTTGISNWKNLPQLSSSLPFREIIFCQGTLSFADIISGLQQLPGGIVTKIHAQGSSGIVGSNSKDTSGEAVSKENGFKLSDPYNRRLKRLIDIATSFLGLITFPVQMFIVKKPLAFMGNCFSVLFGGKTWIGYAAVEKNLPFLRQAVMACNGVPHTAKQQLPEESLHMMDYWYARDYEPSADLKLLWRMYPKLGG